MSMVLKLNGTIECTYNGKPRKGTIIELRPKHNMVLVQVGEGEYRNFKIDKMENLKPVK